MALLGLGRAEVILILMLAILLLGARRVSDVARGLRTGWKEFCKASRELSRELTGDAGEDGPEDRTRAVNGLLMTLTFILGSVCLVLLLYELAN